MEIKLFILKVNISRSMYQLVSLCISPIIIITAEVIFQMNWHRKYLQLSMSHLEIIQSFLQLRILQLPGHLSNLMVHLLT